jgi:S1-C subfamily serine protease
VPTFLTPACLLLPLLDSAGRLIGVNTAIFSPSGASAGIGFAIPVDEVNRIVPRLVQGDFVTAINDQPVETLDDMLTALERLQPGDTSTVTLWRSGATRKVTVKLGESDD